MSIHHGYPSELAIAFEASQGQAPADWLVDEAAGTAAKMAFIECDPTFIRGESAVENQEHQADLYAEAQPLHGLKTADGGSLKCYLHGAGATTNDGEQLAASWQHRLLRHALGGGTRGYATTVASVTSATQFEVASAQGIEAGHILALASADDPQRPHPVQVVSVQGTTVNIDRELPFALDNAVVHPAAMAWPSAEALTNPDHVDYSTISALMRRGNRTWQIQGGHLALEGIDLERGSQPMLNFSILAAYGRAPGGTPPPTAWPLFTGPTQGRERTLALGRDTLLFLQEKGTANFVRLHLWGPSFAAGVPIAGNDTVTEVDANMQGRAGYIAQRGQTTLEASVVLDEEWQARWLQDKRFVATYYQIGPAGNGWAIHMPECFSAEPPELIHEGSLKFKLRLRATVDETATTEAGRAKFIFAQL